MTYQMRTPRKWRTVAGSSLHTGTILGKDKVFRARVGDPAYNWVGRRLVQWDGESIWDYGWQLQSLRESAWREGSTYGEMRTGRGNQATIPDIIHEYDIAKATRGNIYRILWMRDGRLVSQPTIERIPSRLNLYVDANTMIVQGAEYY
jgi:hypothetical protein